MEVVGIFMAILSILRPKGILMATWYIWWSFGLFFPFGMLYRVKSGNPFHGRVEILPSCCS
jgi:hypothetical protein